jgi:hypothetical protein
MLRSVALVRDTLRNIPEDAILHSSNQTVPKHRPTFHLLRPHFSWPNTRGSIPNWTNFRMDWVLFLFRIPEDAGSKFDQDVYCPDWPFAVFYYDR